jgi:outer membrane protein assembly factor BamB
MSSSLKLQVRFPHISALAMYVMSCWIITASSSLADDWPQWRGPNRTNISAETGLLTSWPADGPPLAWEAQGFGDGVVPVSVAGGRVFCTGYRGDDEFCTAVSEADGKPVWSVRIGPAVKELFNMRWLNQRTPTVDGELLYVVTVLGDYICLEAASGKEVWRKNAFTDFGAKKPIFGFCDYPLVDGDNLIISPGAADAAIVALDKRTGATIWKCRSETVTGPAHSALVAAEIGGVKQYINSFALGLIGASAKDGTLLWEFPRNRSTAVTHSPLVEGDTVFYASGYMAGHVLLKLTPDGDRFSVAEVYNGKLRYSSWLGSLTQLGGHIFSNPQTGLACLDRATGEVTWQARKDWTTYTVAEGNLYLWSTKGTLSLVAADPKEFRLISEFIPFETLASRSGIAFPVIANGRLFIRDLDTLRCYDIRNAKAAAGAIPDAVYVPTPDDIVPRLLELAKIERTDLVYDLGSGDGRLVIAAAKKYGCKGVGIEIDPDLVAIAKENAAKEGVAGGVTFHNEDLFKADFSKATVLTLYILPEMLERLIPKFNALQKGSRIVSHEFAIPGVEPREVIEAESAEDGAIRKLYLYSIPLEPDRQSKSPSGPMPR